PSKVGGGQETPGQGVGCSDLTATNNRSFLPLERLSRHKFPCDSASSRGGSPHRLTGISSRSRARHGIKGPWGWKYRRIRERDAAIQPGNQPIPGYSGAPIACPV